MVVAATRLRVLILEDNLIDARLLVAGLKRGGFAIEWLRAEDENSFGQALAEQELDLILADYSLPSFDALRALRFLEERHLDVPFIVVTGTVSEEIAVECMKHGAADYLLKDRLERLPEAVKSALTARQMRLEKAESEHALLDANERAVRDYSSLLTRLDDLAKGVGAGSDLGTIYRALFTFAVASTPADRIIVGLDGALSHGLRGAFAAAVVDGLHVEPSDGDLANIVWDDDRHKRAIREARPVWSNDLDASRATRIAFRGPAIVRTAPPRSAIVVPLLHLGRVIGTFELQSTEHAAFSEQDSTALSMAANLVAVATENLHLLRRERESRRTVEASESRFRSLVQNASDIVTLLQADGTVLYDSGSITGVLGYDPESRVGASVFEHIHHDDAAKVRGALEQLLHTRDLGRFEYRIKDAHGRWRWCESVAADLLDDPAVGGIVVNTRDISGRKRAEVEISRLNTDLRRRLSTLTALHAIDDAITGSVDLRLTLGVVLDQVTALLGVDAAAVLLYEDSSMSLELAASRGFRNAGSGWPRIRLGEGPVGKALLERTTLELTDPRRVEEMLAHSPELLREGFGHAVAVPLIAQGGPQGALLLLHRRHVELTEDRLQIIDSLAIQTAIAIHSATLFQGLQRSNVELRLAYDTTIEGWANALDLKDEETHGHSQRVTNMTVDLARYMGVSEDELVHIRRGALLHDIGKMGVPDAILLKPAELDEEERKIMQRHTTHAYELLSPIGFLKPALDIPYCHHERWDGSGYPRGLAGEQIPSAARIFAVVDVFDALSSDRPYRRAWDADRVREHLQGGAGSHFDPRVVKAFMELRNRR